MSHFTSDFFQGNIPNWERWLAPFKGQPVSALEIGSYEGRSACWLLENILTHPDARLVCVDTFCGGQDLPDKDTLQVFTENIHPWRFQVTVVARRSQDALPTLPGPGLFDFAYIDGSHYAADVLEDGRMVWLKVRTGGLLIFDDYGWVLDPDVDNRPKAGIDAFLASIPNQYELVGMDWQVAIKKL